jgi:DNA-directed RNA polymerase subunit RPC12/RpoP
MQKMSALCSKCHAPVADPWKFCPLCGTAIPLEPTPTAAPETPPGAAQKAPAKGAFTGLLFGMLAVPILAIVGAMLCLTGLGAILGIPLIVCGVIAPLAGPMIGLGELKGACPWCGAHVASFMKRPGFFCHACSKRIAIRRGKFAREETAAQA